jgi:putative transposase
MTRLGRYRIAGQPQHVIHRGNNRQAIFFRDADHRRYRAYLAEAAETHGCAVHAYVLMTNHLHLLVTPERAESLPSMMQSLGRRYTGYVNAVQERTGTLWEGRYRATVIDGEAYFLACSRYIECNPLRAGMVSAPGDYPWSSYGANGLGRADPLVRPHGLYLALGATPAERQAAYRALFASEQGEPELTVIRGATNHGWALGDADFLNAIEGEAGRRVRPRPRGRPRKRAI